MGTSGFLLEPSHDVGAGIVYASFIFHFAYASTATTIVSGAIAGRMKFSCYIIYAFFSSIFYGFPAHWVWSEDGFLQKYGFHDFAGCGPVHLFGACGAFYGALCLGPRAGRFKPDGSRGEEVLAVYDPISVICGFLMIWWGWIGFNCGSTFGSAGIKGTIAVRVGAVTVIAACGGGVFTLIRIFFPKQLIKSLSASMKLKQLDATATDAHPINAKKLNILNKIKRGLKQLRVDSNHVKVEELTNAILSALVSITAACNCVNLRCSFLIGLFAPPVTSSVNMLAEYYRIDDPVGAIGVHGAGGIYGLLCVGLFADTGLPGVLEYMPTLEKGIFLGGPISSLGRQIVGALMITAWGMVSSFLIFSITSYILGGNRVSLEIEMDGIDVHEHEYDLIVTRGSEVGDLARRRRHASIDARSRNSITTLLEIQNQVMTKNQLHDNVNVHNEGGDDSNEDGQQVGLDLWSIITGDAGAGSNNSRNYNDDDNTKGGDIELR